MPQTVFDAILASLRAAADYHKDDAVQPAAVLWPDEKREWERLVPRLRRYHDTKTPAIGS